MLAYDGAMHACSHGGPLDLQVVVAVEAEAVLCKDQLDKVTQVTSWWFLCCSAVECFLTCLIPSWCGMLAYSEETSKVASSVPSGRCGKLLQFYQKVCGVLDVGGNLGYQVRDNRQTGRSSLWVLHVMTQWVFLGCPACEFSAEGRAWLCGGGVVQGSPWSFC